MRATVLESFPFAENGIDVKTLEAGESFDCPDDIFDGLEAAKLVKASGAAKPADKPVEKPADKPAVAPASKTADSLFSDNK